MTKISKTPATLQAQSTEDNNLPDPRQVNMYSESPKIPTETLEKALSDRLSRLSGFKALSLPCAILKHSQDEVLVGVPKDMVGPLYSNYTLKSGLEQAVGAVFKRPGVRVKTRQADPECVAARARLEALKRAEEKLEREKQEVDRQKEMGRCDIIPFPRNEEKIRVSANLFKNPIFVSNNYKGSLWVYENEFEDQKTGLTHRVKIQVGCPKGQVVGVLKQKHQAVLFELFKIWEEQGYKISEVDDFTCGIITLSIYELLERVFGKMRTGGRDYQRLYLMLQEMKTIPICVETQTSNQSTPDIEAFSLFDFSWTAKGSKFWEHEAPTKESKVQIRFAPALVKNFIKKNIKPLLYGEYKAVGIKNSQKTGDEELLYAHLDGNLSKKENYNILLGNLPRFAGTSKHQKKGRRKATMDKVVCRLHGRFIQNKKYTLHLLIQECADGSDYKLVARRIPVK